MIFVVRISYFSFLPTKNLASFTASEGIAFCSYNEILIFILDYCLLAQTQSCDVALVPWVATLRAHR